MNNNLLQGADLGTLTVFLTSLAIGLLIGLEREKSPAAKAGLRTFSLVALAGTLSALLSEHTGAPWILGAGLLVLGGMMVASYFRGPEVTADPGTTTVAAVVVCYGLGAIVWYGYAQLAVMLAIASTILLYFKPELHGVTENITRQDLVSFLQFAVLSLIILPILPNTEYGPYSALNPHQIWLMVVLISGLSLAGYAALRIIGQKKGIPLLGLFGGLVSSTATTLVYARHARANADFVALSSVVVLIANLVVLVRLGILVAVVSPGLLPPVLPMLAAGLVAGALVTAWWWHGMQRNEVSPELRLTNPTEISTALGFGLLYAVVLFAAAWLNDFAGSLGLYAVSVVSGITDVDAITLSTLRLFDLDKLAPGHACASIMLAYLANLAFKLALTLGIGGRSLALRVAPGFLAAATGVVAAWWTTSL